MDTPCTSKWMKKPERLNIRYNTFQRKKFGITVHHIRIKLCSWLETMRMLYWAFYGYLAPWDMSLYTGTLGLGKKEEHLGHWWNEAVGECLVAAFYICEIVILLNLMIAMMCTTAATIAVIQ